MWHWVLLLAVIFAVSGYGVWRIKKLMRENKDLGVRLAASGVENARLQSRIEGVESENAALRLECHQANKRLDDQCDNGSSFDYDTHQR